MRRIAFIDKVTALEDIPLRLDQNSDISASEGNHTLKIHENLRKVSLLKTYKRLNEDTLKQIKEDSRERPFDIIITHVPMDKDLLKYYLARNERFNGDPEIQERLSDEWWPLIYQNSLGLIEQIYEAFPSTEIIAYTGAGKERLSDRELFNQGVKGVFRKQEEHLDFNLRELEEIVGKFDRDKFSSVDKAAEHLIDPLELDNKTKDKLKKRLAEAFFLVNIQNLTLDKKGYTSTGVIKAGKIVIKIDLEKRLDKELDTYQQIKRTEFQDFSASLIPNITYAVVDNVGFLPLTNIDQECVQGLRKANQRYNVKLMESGLNLFTKHDFYYNLFLMGLFHRCATQFDDVFKRYAEITPYIGVDGIPYHEGDNPGINLTKEALNIFKKTDIPKSEVRTIINDYNQLIKEMHEKKKTVIIDGDWKEDNIVKGHKIDFAMVGYGLEIDDLAYYASDSKYNLRYNDFIQVVIRYRQLRAIHDNIIETFTHEDVLNEDKLIRTAWLRQLVRRHSVMKKRDLMDNDKYQQRLYYQHMINETLKDGRFI